MSLFMMYLFATFVVNEPHSSVNKSYTFLRNSLRFACCLWGNLFIEWHDLKVDGTFKGR